MGYEHPKRYAESSPDRPAVIVGDTAATLSYGAMESRSNRLANAFRSLGLGVGDHVAILMENRLEYFEAVWAGMRSGLFVTPINWHLSSDEVEYIIRDCGASVLVTSSACAALTRGAVADVKLAHRRWRIRRGFRFISTAFWKPSRRPRSRTSAKAAGCIYSSGTTGRPKGIKPPSVGGVLGEESSFTGLVRGLYGGDESTVYLSPAPFIMQLRRVGPARCTGWAALSSH